VRFWDLTKGGPPRTVKAHKGAVNCVVRSPDGTRLVTGGSDGKVQIWDARIWDTTEGVPVKLVASRPGRILAAVFNPKGTYLAWAGDEGIVHVWDVVREQEARALQGHAGVIFGLAFSPDGLRLASAGGDGTVRLWDTVGASPPRVFRGNTNEVNCVAFSPDGSRLASGSDDRSVRVWDVVGGAEVCVLKHHKGFVDGVTFSPDGTQLASCSADGTVQIVDARPWTPESHIEQEVRGLVEGLFSRPLLKAEVLAQVKSHKGITEAIRRRALELAGRFHDEPERFRRASRNVVRYQGAAPALYRQALGWAQTACALGPDNGPCLTTVAIAQYRLGQYAEALKTLSRAESLNRADPSNQPAELAFLAMAHQRLAHKGEAAAALKRLHNLMKWSRLSIDQEALTFLAEAEALLAP
jgi:hypothetical protein